MPEYNFFQYVLSPGFLIMAGLTLAAFAPLAYSVWRTWEQNAHKVETMENLSEKAREDRARVRRRIAAGREAKA